jgi:hypothetical protein
VTIFITCFIVENLRISFTFRNKQRLFPLERVASISGLLLKGPTQHDTFPHIQLMRQADTAFEKSRDLNMSMTMGTFQHNVYITNSPQSQTFKVSLKRLPRIFILRYLRVELELIFFLVPLHEPKLTYKQVAVVMQISAIQCYYIYIKLICNV